MLSKLLLFRHWPSRKQHELVVITKNGDLASGVYLYRIEAGSFQQMRKKVLLKKRRISSELEFEIDLRYKCNLNCHLIDTFVNSQIGKLL
jgi:hypothetical protein